MSKHTPGPWCVQKGPRSNSLPHIRGADWSYVLDCPARGSSAHATVRQMADARLIAAAPCLLEAVKEYITVLNGRAIDEMRSPDYPYLQELKALVARIEEGK